MELARPAVSASVRVVGSGRKSEDPSNFENAPVAQFPQQGYRFEPAEALFDPLAFSLADLVTSVPGSSAINGTATRAIGVLRYMRCDVHLAALGYKISGVVALVGSYRDALLSRDLLDHQ